MQAGEKCLDLAEQPQWASEAKLDAVTGNVRHGALGCYLREEHTKGQRIVTFHMEISQTGLEWKEEAKQN